MLTETLSVAALDLPPLVGRTGLGVSDSLNAEPGIRVQLLSAVDRLTLGRLDCAGALGPGFASRAVCLMTQFLLASACFSLSRRLPHSATVFTWRGSWLSAHRFGSSWGKKASVSLLKALALTTFNVSFVGSGKPSTPDSRSTFRLWSLMRVGKTPFERDSHIRDVRLPRF